MFGIRASTVFQFDLRKTEKENWFICWQKSACASFHRYHGSLACFSMLCPFFLVGGATVPHNRYCLTSCSGCREQGPCLRTQDQHHRLGGDCRRWSFTVRLYNGHTKVYNGHRLSAGHAGAALLVQLEQRRSLLVCSRIWRRVRSVHHRSGKLDRSAS